MTTKKWAFLILFLVFGCCAVSANASVYVCQKGTCDSADSRSQVHPWLRRLYTLFKQPNARIDFCEGDAKKHACKSNDLVWHAKSPTIDVTFQTPVARTIPGAQTLMLDYLVTANESMPTCKYSQTTFDITPENSIRMLSHAFRCQIFDTAITNIQNTIFIDYIDLDNAVLGGQYVIQTDGAVTGGGTGYVLMRLRNGETLRPLVAINYETRNPELPLAPEQYRRAFRSENNPDQPKDFKTELSDWWEELKYSFNLDKKKYKTPRGQEPHWWSKFSDTFMKVIYLEPLD